MICDGCGKRIEDEHGRLIQTRTGKEVCGPTCAERCDKLSLVQSGEWKWRPGDKQVGYWQ